MAKKLSTKPNTQLARSGIKRLRLATSSIVALAGVGYLVFVGFSPIAIMAAISGVMYGLGSLVAYKIRKHSPLPDKSNRSLRQRLNKLKFTSERYYDEIERLLAQEKQLSSREQQLTNTLSNHFSPAELTYNRYYDAGLKVITSINQHIESTAALLEKVQGLDNEQNIEIIVTSIKNNMDGIDKLSLSFENFLMSFERSSDFDRDEIFRELTELSKRTSKYLDLK